VPGAVRRAPSWPEFWTWPYARLVSFDVLALSQQYQSYLCLSTLRHALSVHNLLPEGSYAVHLQLVLEHLERGQAGALFLSGFPRLAACVNVLLIQGVPLQKMLILTFSVKSTLEMRERLEREGISRVGPGTSLIRHGIEQAECLRMPAAACIQLQANSTTHVNRQVGLDTLHCRMACCVLRLSLAFCRFVVSLILTACDRACCYVCHRHSSSPRQYTPGKDSNWRGMQRIPVR